MFAKINITRLHEDLGCYGDGYFCVDFVLSAEHSTILWTRSVCISTLCQCVWFHPGVNKQATLCISFFHFAQYSL